MLRILNTQDLTTEYFMRELKKEELQDRVNRTSVSKEEDEMARYGKKAQETVKEAMEKFKKGKLKSGRSGRKVTSRKQAVAIGLSEAREKGAKVPSASKKAM
jgi:uncharacterized protein DUF6496